MSHGSGFESRLRYQEKQVMIKILINISENDKAWLQRYCNRNRRLGLTMSAIIRQQINRFRAEEEAKDARERRNNSRR